MSSGLIFFMNQAKRLNASSYQGVMKSGPPEQTKAGAGSTAAAYVGSHDIADCRHVLGWVYNKSAPEAMVDVAILDGDKLVATVHANQFRPDVADAGFGTGRYGFDYPIPPAWKDGRVHSIRVKIAETNFDLLNTPRSLVCSP
jgi:hypothetical protein